MDKERQWQDHFLLYIITLLDFTRIARQVGEALGSAGHLDYRAVRTEVGLIVVRFCQKLDPGGRVGAARRDREGGVLNHSVICRCRAKEPEPPA